VVVKVVPGWAPGGPWEVSLDARQCNPDAPSGH
jgi:hypothetical protein